MRVGLNVAYSSEKPNDRAGKQTKKETSRMRVGTTAYRYQPPICRSLAGIPDTPSSRQISKHLGFLLYMYWFCALHCTTAFKGVVDAHTTKSGSLFENGCCPRREARGRQGSRSSSPRAIDCAYSSQMIVTSLAESRVASSTGSHVSGGFARCAQA